MIETRPLTPEFLVETAELARVVYGTGRMREILADTRRTIERWMWLEGNPMGGAPGWVALSGSRVVGHVGTLPVVVASNGESVRAAWARDLFVHPDFRQAGAGSTLITTALDASGHLLLGGLNPIVRRVYRRLGYIDMGPVPLYIRPVPSQLASAIGWPRPVVELVRSATFRLTRLVPATGRPSTSTGEVADFDERFDRWWPGVESKLGCVARRTTESMRWRYRNHPMHRYRIIAASDGLGLRGIVVLRVALSRGLRTGFIVELLVDPDDRDAQNGLVSESTRILDLDSVALIRSNVTHPRLGRALIRHGFIRVPANFHWMRAETKGVTEDLASCSQWMLNAGDSDLDAL